jgi:hypothetical protein
MRPLLSCWLIVAQAFEPRVVLRRRDHRHQHALAVARRTDVDEPHAIRALLDRAEVAREVRVVAELVVGSDLVPEEVDRARHLGPNGRHQQLDGDEQERGDPGVAHGAPDATHLRSGAPRAFRGLTS